MHCKKQGVNREYQEYFIANTEDGNLNMLSYEIVTAIKGFEEYTLEEFALNICHEFTHICQQALNSESPGWFWEVLATNLGNPENQSEIQSDFSLNDLYNKFDEIDGYDAAYKLGRYLFSNYDNNFILNLVKNNNMLHSFEEEWIKKVKCETI